MTSPPTGGPLGPHTGPCSPAAMVAMIFRMETFSTELSANYTTANDLEGIHRDLEFLASRRVSSVDGLAASPVSRIPVKVSVVFQVGIRRVLELANSTIREANLQNLSSMCVLARSAFETTVLLYDVAEHVREFVEADQSEGLASLDDYLVKTLLGHKAKAWAVDEAIQATNVLTIMKRLDKQFQGLLMRFYEGLSEYAHPNYHGMLATYGGSQNHGDDEAIRRFSDRQPGRDVAATALVVGALASALHLATNAVVTYEAYQGGLAALSERHIFERGTWPDDQAYPVKR